jgi:hypothetical protein
VSTDIAKPKAIGHVMEGWVKSRWIDWAAGKKGDALTKDTLREEIDAVALELAGPEPTPIERTLAETAALSWFALRLHESHFAGGATSDDGLTINQSEHHQRRVDRAHRRFLATLKTLAMVRRLAIPTLQINLARQQINVASVHPSCPSIDEAEAD